MVKHFPDLQVKYSTLDGDLRELGLSGSDRISTIAQSISDLIKGDASSAPQQLGLEQCPLINDLAWAQNVTQSLRSGLKEILQSLNNLSQIIHSLPNGGIPGDIRSQSEDIFNEIDSLKNSDDYCNQIDRFKELHDALEKLGSEGFKALEEQHAKKLNRKPFSQSNNLLPGMI